MRRVAVVPGRAPEDTRGGGAFAGRAAACVLLTCLLGLPAAAAAEVTKHYPDSVLVQGEKGIFAVEMLAPKGGLTMGVNAVEIIVHDADDRDVPGASVRVIPWMPEHRHGVEEEPVVFDRGGGVYSAEHLELGMTGWWELTVEVRKGDLFDRAVFSFPDVGAGGSHAGMKMGSRSEIDTAPSVVSEKGLFRLGYESDEVPVPLNRLHGWTVSVMSTDGTAVQGASLQVVGDMPEHGHGLPTQPEMTEELGGGRYRVEGIRFSMPGWWVLTFHVSAGGKVDNASFNLLVE